MSDTLARRIRRLWPARAPRATYPIGLHVGMNNVTLVQMRPQGSHPSFRAAASTNYGCPRSELLADPPRLKALIKRALSDYPFRGRRVVSCLPNDQIKLLVLNFTAAEGESDSDAVVRELRMRMRGELDGKIVDFVPVRQREFPPRPNEAIVAIAERDRVTAYLNLLSACGLKTEALEIGPVAIARLVSWIRSDTPGEFPNVLLITFGSRSSFLTVLWGRRLMFDRGVDFAEHQLVARLRTVLDIPEQAAMELLLQKGFVGGTGNAEDGKVGNMLKEILRPELNSLKTEVNRTLGYIASKSRGRTVDKIYAAGSIARYPGVEEFLRDQFTLPVEVLNAFSIFPHALKASDMERLWPHSGVAAATGMALRGMPVPWPTST